MSKAPHVACYPNVEGGKRGPRLAPDYAVKAVATNKKRASRPARFFQCLSDDYAARLIKTSVTSLAASNSSLPATAATSRVSRSKAAS